MLTAGVTVFFGDQSIHCFQKGRLVRSRGGVKHRSYTDKFHSENGMRY